MRVPVSLYLELIGSKVRSDYALRHQRIEDGHVLFDTEKEMGRLEVLLHAHNSGEPLPFLMADGGNPVWEARESLVNLRKSGNGWYSAQCPSCAKQGADGNGKNHLQVKEDGGFGCVRKCKRKDILDALKELAPPKEKVPEIAPGQSVLFSFDNAPKPKAEPTPTPVVLPEPEPEVREETPFDRARLVHKGEKKERYLHVTEMDGEVRLTVWRKSLDSGERSESTSVVNLKACRTLWVFLSRYPVGETIPPLEIRAFLAEKHRMSVEEWGAYGKARRIYLENHNTPLLWLQYHRVIDYRANGSVFRLEERLVL